jgi:thioredoxin-like negative regulator of GroEL
LRVAIATSLLIGAAMVAAADSPTADTAVSQLVQQADFWHAKGRGDLAQQALNRVLAADPAQADALYRHALFAAQEGRNGVAREWLDKLRAAAPDDARVATLESMLQRGRIPAGEIGEARRLARSGDAAAAVAAYQALFDGGAPPPDLALEYYQTLAGTDAGWAPAREALARIAADKPRDLGSQLAYAQVLTWREDTRREGIARLARLGAVDATAAQSWRQALLWLHARTTDKPLYDAYARAHPDDAQVSTYFHERTTQRKVAPKVAATTLGFRELEAGDARAAETRFRAALARDPHNADALGGLGILRLRAGDFTAARDHLSRAIAADPGHKSRWSESLASAEFFAALAELDALRDARNWPAVEQGARKLAARGGPNRHLAELRLAEALFQQDRVADAERVYRGVLAHDQDSADAAAGLFQSLLAQGKANEANQILARLPEGDRDRLGSALDRARAERLRSIGRQQAAAGKLALAADNLASALAADPGDPWVRLDLARVLIREGKSADASRLMDGLAAGNDASADALHAAALFATENRRWDQAERLIERIPDAKRSADIDALARRIALEDRLTRAKSLAAEGRGDEAATQLRTLAGSTTDAGARGRAARALLELGRVDEALAIARADLESGARGTPSAYQGQLAVLAASGHDAEAIALLRQIERHELGDEERAQMADLVARFAADRADRLRLEGNLADAWDVLSQALATNPGDTNLRLALARVYTSGRMPADALQVYDDLLAQHPDDPQVLRAAAAAAVEAKDTRAASDLLEQAMRAQPRDAELYLLAGRLAKERGDHRTALRMLQTAQSLNRGVNAIDATDSGNATVRTPAGALGPNPFRRDAAAVDASASARQFAYGDRVVEHPRRGADADVGMFLPVSDVVAIEAPPRMYTRDAAAARAPDEDAASLLYVPSDAPVAGGERSRYAAAPVATDPLERQIERELADLRTPSRAITLQSGIGLRQRNGEAGLSRLTEITAPAALSLPVGSGTLAVTAEPVFLSAGKPEGDANVRFGSNPLVADAPPQAGNQRDAGVALKVAYDGRVFAADIGTTPLGFQEGNIVGGVAFTPQVTEHSRLEVHLEQRAVTDSVLSYAGTRDVRTGERWGGVTKAGGGVSWSFDDGDAGLYAEAMAHRYTGTNVEDNTGAQANIGGYIRPVRGDSGELKVGVNLTYLGFDKNLRYFTRGHGGYFSPQQYASLSFPAEWSASQGNFNYRLAAALGYQHYTEDDTPLFPGEPGLADALPRALAKDLPGPPVRVIRGRGSSTVTPTGPGDATVLPAVYAGRTKSGIGVSVSASGEYALTPSTAVGGEVSVDSFGDYTESRLMVYLRHMFGGGQ